MVSGRFETRSSLMDGQLIVGSNIKVIKNGKHMLELAELVVVTPIPAQTTNGIWLGFFTRDGEAVVIKGKKANGVFL